MQFNTDGSLKVLAQKKKRDHIPLLTAVNELPFGVGKKLLIDHLRGKQNSRSAKLRLDQYFSFGQLGGFQEEEIAKLIGHLQRSNFITTKREGKYTTLALTPQGKEELDSPTQEIDINGLNHEHAISNPFTEPTTFSDEEKKLFLALNDFFPRFSDEQRKAVISNAKRILCVAGAGSGKTSVLTKRIEFLIKYKSVKPEKILAITFTRKARQEMQNRLNLPVSIETFNSFCEKILQKHSSTDMVSPKDKMRLLLESLRENNQSPSSITNTYYTQNQRRGKEEKSLFFSFFYDVQSLVDKIKLSKISPDELVIPKDHEHAHTAELLRNIASSYLEKLKMNQYRDYADQLIETIDLFRSSPNIIPRYDYVLVDEYQDVNDVQIELIDLLGAPNLFVVGDPRQSIYGWRGSKIQHILEFKDAQVIQLTTNYRSKQAIIEVCNGVMRNSGYHPLKAKKESKGMVRYVHHTSEAQQASTIARTILDYKGPKSDIFVLSRTNKGLRKIQDACDQLSIPYIMRTEDSKRANLNPQAHQITLATVHAIKGLEAKRVHIIGANNFPCNASDHPVMELFNLNQEYDSYAEEIRVLYVALSRAEDELLVHYTGFLSKFFPSQTMHDAKVSSTDSVAAMMKLRQWRYRQAQEKSVPAYVICSDKTLDALLEFQPNTVDDLHQIPGLGVKRIQEFGQEIIAVLSSL